MQTYPRLLGFGEQGLERKIYMFQRLTAERQYRFLQHND